LAFLLARNKWTQIWDRRIALTRPSPQVLGDETLQSHSLNFCRSIQWSLRADEEVQTGIKREELVTGNQMTIGEVGEYGKAYRKK